MRGRERKAKVMERKMSGRGEDVWVGEMWNKTNVMDEARRQDELIG